MFTFFQKNKYSTSESVDIIEKIVYDYLKPLGFRKHGRTLHRFVEGDISQVVNLQNGCPQKGVHGILWVNLGVRVPECVERTFEITEPLKMYYHEYECNIRTTLGDLVEGKQTSYNLKKDPYAIGEDIVKRLKQHVVPVFDVLNSRQAILAHRREYPRFDIINDRMILLEEAMIFGRMGDRDKAVEWFNLYYRGRAEECRYDIEHGEKEYLRKGQRVVYFNSRTQ